MSANYDLYALAIGKAVAKAFLDQVFGVGLIARIGEELIDVVSDITGDNTQDRQASRMIADVARQISSELKGYFESEARNISPSQHQSIASVVADVLNQPELTSDLLLEHYQNPQSVASVLLEKQSVNLRDLSEVESEAVRNTVIFACKKILDTASQFPGWHEAEAKFNRFDHLHTHRKLDRVLDLQERRYQEYEQIYKQQLIARLSAFEPLGIEQVGDIARSPKIIDGYVPLTLTLKEFYSINISEFLEKRRGVTKGTYTEESLRELFAENLRFDVSKAIKHKLSATQAVAQAFGTFSSSEIFSIFPKLVIGADAGFGKTTILRWLAVMLAKDRPLEEINNLRDYIPIYVRLRAVQQDGFPSLNQFINTVLHFSAPEGWVENILKNGRGILLIDGVDEITSERRTELVNILKELVIYGNNRFVITSRPYAIEDPNWHEWHEWIKEYQFTVAEITSLTSSQSNRIIESWYEAYIITKHPDAEYKEELRHKMRDLQFRMSQSSELRTLATTPLVCVMLCVLNLHSNAVLPNTRLRLYEACTKMFLIRRDQERGMQLIPNYLNRDDIDVDILVTILQEVAYSMSIIGTVETTEDKVLQWIKNSLREFPTLGLDPQAVLNYLIERSHILVEPEVGKITFAHKSFQEYFAAGYMANNGVWETLIIDAPSDRWQNTTILIGGMLTKKEREDLLKGLLDKADSSDKDVAKSIRLLSLACLAVAQFQPTSIEIQNRVTNANLLYLPPRSEFDAQAFALIGEQAIDISPMPDPQDISTYFSMKYSLQMLGLIGGSRALEKISEIADLIGKAADHVPEEWLDTEMFLKLRNVFNLEEYDKSVLSKINALSLTQPIPSETFRHLVNLKRITLERGYKVTQSRIDFVTHIPSVEYLKLSIPIVSGWEDILKIVPPLQNLNFDLYTIEPYGKNKGTEKHEPVIYLKDFAIFTQVTSLMIGANQFGFNYPLPKSPPPKMRLEIGDEPIDNFDLSLNRFIFSPTLDCKPLINTQSLYLYDCDLLDWSIIPTFFPSLAFMHLHISTEFTESSSDDLSPLNKLTKLRKLSIFVASPSAVKINGLTALKNLKVLRIQNFSQTIFNKDEIQKELSETIIEIDEL